MIIGGWHPLTLSDFPGTPAAILFLQGCNWRCRYCHNRSLLPMKAPQAVAFEEIVRKLKQRVGRIKGVVFTGGEPTLHADLDEHMAQLQELGLKIKLDTNGTSPAALRHLLERKLLDFIAMDLKAPWPAWERVTGCPLDRQPLEESIRLIAESGLDHQFRTTLDKELLSEEEMAALREIVPPGSPYKVQEMVER